MKRGHYSKQMDMLESAIKFREELKKEHEPFLLLQPWGIIIDEFYLNYYPEGVFQPPVKHGPLNFRCARELLNSYPGKLQCQISLGKCTEWLFVLNAFSNHAQIYTTEQVERTVQKFTEDHPELKLLLSADGINMRETLAKLPQSFTVSLKHLQHAIQEV